MAPTIAAPSDPIQSQGNRFEHRRSPPRKAGRINLCYTYSATPVTTAELRVIRQASVELQLPREAPKQRRKWNHLDEQARAGVMERYEAGETSTALASHFGVAKSTSLGILRGNNVVVRRQRLEPAVVAEAARLYESGLSLSQVATSLNVNQETMRVAILAAGVVLRSARRV